MVVAIIALLIAILVPSLNQARKTARMIMCTGQLQHLMKAALLYSTDHRNRSVGVGRIDTDFANQYDAGTRRDYLTWLGIWRVYTPGVADKWENWITTPAYHNAPRGGRLWKYYREPALLKCPSALRFNGKSSYSTPENVALAMRDPGGQRMGLPPKTDLVKHPAAAVEFLDEDEENGISNYSFDDGFAEGDQFATRHMGKSTIAFFDGHAEAGLVPVVKKSNGEFERMTGWMIQIAPFNCRYTPLPWRFRGAANMPKFKKDANWPYDVASRVPPGVE